MNLLEGTRAEGSHNKRIVSQPPDCDLKRMKPLKSDELQLMDRYWRAANYLSVGQIYLYDNPLRRIEPPQVHYLAEVWKNDENESTHGAKYR